MRLGCEIRFDAAWLRSMRVGCEIRFVAAWLRSMRQIVSMRLGSENRFDAALPPDVRRGYASPVGFSLVLGLRPWFGLCPGVV